MRLTFVPSAANFIMVDVGDVPLGDHPAEYGMQAKYAKLAAGAPNPFIDKANCFAEVDIQQAMYRAVLAEQQQTSSRP